MTIHPCPTCERETPHVHEHDCVHGIAETHLGGTERYRCSACGHMTFAHDAATATRGMRFVLDKPRKEDSP